MAWRVGVDSGGTFTDVCLFDDATGRVDGVEGGLHARRPVARHRRGRGRGHGAASMPAPAAVGYFGHGTTVATNALIQHRGVRTGLITTDGFRDLLEIGRQKRPDLYDLQVDKPPVLVPRDLRLEVPERLRHDGTRRDPAGRGGVPRRGAPAARRPACRRSPSASCTASSAPTHEAAARRILAEEFPEAFACVSHQVAPEFREFERLSTTVVNAYLGPVMRGYIERLAERLRRARHDRDAAPDAVQRRRDRLRAGGAAAGAHRAVRALHRRGRRAGGRAGSPASPT